MTAVINHNGQQITARDEDVAFYQEPGGTWWRRYVAYGLDGLAGLAFKAGGCALVLLLILAAASYRAGHHLTSDGVFVPTAVFMVGCWLVAVAAKVAARVIAPGRSADVDEMREALFMLQGRLAAVAPPTIANCPAFGCVGCGAWMADVRVSTEPGSLQGESYCWSCVDDLGIAEYTVLPDRASNTRM